MKWKLCTLIHSETVVPGEKPDSYFLLAKCVKKHHCGRLKGVGVSKGAGH